MSKNVAGSLLLPLKAIGFLKKYQNMAYPRHKTC
jgi:hypothetical protein